MKVKRSLWRKIRYGNSEKFTYWSPKIRGKGDETLAEGSSIKDWRKVVVVQPSGSPETAFSMGFSNVFGDTKISSAVRKVKDGPFGMRMGPKPCDFFIASNQGKVDLRLIEYTDIKDKTKSDLFLY